jgi:integrase
MLNIDAAKIGRTSTGITGLYLHVTSRGQRRWVFRFSRPHNAGVTEMSLGPATQANWTAVQVKVLQLRAQLAEGVDPIAHRRKERNLTKTFGDACTGYINHQNDAWSTSQLRHANLLLHVHGSALAKVPIAAINEDILISALKPVWDRFPKRALTALNMWKRVLDFAGRHANNPAVWKGNLEFRFPRQKRLVRNHYPSMPYSQVPAFLAVLRHSQSRSIAAVALELVILTASRPGEVLGMQWSEIDLSNRVWTISAHRTKQRREHKVPLCDRAIALLQRQREYSTGSPNVFVGYMDPKPLSEPSFKPYMRDIGTTATVHGFRASFKTWGTEKTDYPRELIELCLAHRFGSDTEEAYQRGDIIEKRRRIMDAWAAHCLSDVA